MFTGSNRMKSILFASAIALLVAGTAAAQPLDDAPSAQLRYEMKFGGSEAPKNTSALRFAAGIARPISDDSTTLEDRRARSAATAPLVPLFDASYSFRSQESDLRLAGLSLIKRDSNPALDAAGERSWWQNNWGWVAVAGIAAAAVVAVTAIHSGNDYADNYTPPPDNNKCSGTASVELGNQCVHGP
jgi:hypothetical protein